MKGSFLTINNVYSLITGHQSMLKCEKASKWTGIQAKYIIRIFQYSQNIFSDIRKNDILWGRKGPQCDHFRTSEKGVGRTWLRRASAAHLCITLSCKTDVKNDPCSTWKKWCWGRKRPQLQISRASHTGVVSDPKACLDPYYWPLFNPTALKKHSYERY